MYLEFGPKSRWKLGNPLWRQSMKREASSFARFGTLEESPTTVSSLSPSSSLTSGPWSSLLVFCIWAQAGRHVTQGRVSSRDVNGPPITHLPPKGFDVKSLVMNPLFGPKNEFHPTVYFFFYFFFSSVNHLFKFMQHFLIMLHWLIGFYIFI